MSELAPILVAAVLLAGCASTTQPAEQPTAVADDTPAVAASHEDSEPETEARAANSSNLLGEDAVAGIFSDTDLEDAVVEARHYRGTIQMLGPDEATPVGEPSEAWMRRTTDLVAETITVEMFRDGKRSLVTQKKVGESTFVATDEDGNELGHFGYDGDWVEPEGWMQDLVHPDGSGTHGRASVAADGRITSKVYWLSADGKKGAWVESDFVPVSVDEFDAAATDTE